MFRVTMKEKQQKNWTTEKLQKKTTQPNPVIYEKNTSVSVHRQIR